MSRIANFSSLTFNNDQLKAAGLLEKFITDQNQNIFLLKGHAGTGKTMLIQAMIKYLKSIERPVVLMASTGRAAKIVAEKARYGAETVHKGIYVLEVDKTDDENKIRRLKFRLKDCVRPEKTVFIIDESSMISDTNLGGKFIDFGTGRLLTDLFTYTGTRKVIFSGDQCQLPPIEALISPSLDATYLRNVHHKTVAETTLTEVMRYRKESGIYQNTDKLRSCIEKKIYHKFQIFVSQHKDHHLHYTEEKLVDSYVNKVGKAGIANVIMIVFKNATAAELNKMIRMKLFPRHRFLVKNELLLIVQNNYKFDVANGEHLIVDQVAKEK
ncbi:MAG: hypothetical protein FJY07_02730, partial [Bacteroidetes bacterium]|nr:hypothetical protein [Bacteroidota bacterium]